MRLQQNVLHILILFVSFELYIFYVSKMHKKSFFSGGKKNVFSCLTFQAHLWIEPWTIDIVLPATNSLDSCTKSSGIPRNLYSSDISDLAPSQKHMSQIPTSLGHLISGPISQKANHRYFNRIRKSPLDHELETKAGLEQKIFLNSSEKFNHSLFLVTRGYLTIILIRWHC